MFSSELFLFVIYCSRVILLCNIFVIISINSKLKVSKVKQIESFYKLSQLSELRSPQSKKYIKKMKKSQMGKNIFYGLSFFRELNVNCEL